MTGTVILKAENLARRYEVRRGIFGGPVTVNALSQADFSLESGKTLAVVGESGCGKSTLARLVTMIESPSAGTLHIDGIDTSKADPGQLKAIRSAVQIVFQDPYGSLNPRQKVGAILEEPLVINTALSATDRQATAKAMMEKVGLRPEHYGRYPHMFSGGQRQRIAIARALMLQPKVVVLDEPVSALDVSIQAQVLNLLSELRRDLGLAYLFISHDLSVVRHVADDVMVMYLGRIVESGPRDLIFDQPGHPYTRALLSATPRAEPGRVKKRIKLEGEPPSPIDPPGGCAFHPRCAAATEKCKIDQPEMEEKSPGQKVACHNRDANLT